nr:metal-dependent hydrolase [Pseudomonadota bacterium]
MDSLTQLILGAAVGERVLGGKAGRRAALWGGVAGTLPDLDIVAAPFVSQAGYLGIHRGLSHSLAFAVLAAPLFGALAARLSPDATWRDWSLLAFWAFFTHIVLDCFTTYGTQVLLPFSDYRVAFSTIFIVDPLYTVPLLAGLLATLLLKRRWANGLGLSLSTFYLLATLANKYHVEAVFSEALYAQDLRYQQLYTYPTALNNLLWVGLARDDAGLWVGLYSLLDEGGQITFRRVPSHSERVAQWRDDPILQRLLWFSHGYYTISESDGALVFNDLHLPRMDNWLNDEGQYVFSYRLLEDPGNPQRLAGIQQAQRSLDLEDGLWR